MDFSLVRNKSRGIQIIIDKKHVKTIPANLSKAINSFTVKRLDYERKRLSYGERRLLSNYAVYENWKTKLATKEKHLFELIKNAVPVEKHLVNSHNKERLELLLDNNVKINVPEKVYYSLPLQEKTTYSNF